MNMLRIATVEDDAHDLEALRTHLNRYEKENGLKFLITEFQDGEDIVTEYSADYDLILMDIEITSSKSSGHRPTGQERPRKEKRRTPRTARRTRGRRREGGLIIKQRG